MTKSNDSIYSITYSVDVPTVDILEPQGLSIPISVFSTELSGLQAVTRYLVEQGFSFAEIAKKLNRSPKTIWQTYKNVEKKPFSYVEDGLRVPLERFVDRRLSILESLVVHITALGFSNVETARLLDLDPRTTWTVKSRAAKKGVRS